MFELLAAAVANVAQLKYLVPLVVGTLVGVIGGALPGVTVTMTIIVALPFTFGLDPLQGLAAMVGAARPSRVGPRLELLARLPTPAPRVTKLPAVITSRAVPGVEIVRAAVSCGVRKPGTTLPR